MAIFRGYSPVNLAVDFQPAGLQTTQQTQDVIVRTGAGFVEQFNGSFDYAGNGDVSGELDSLSTSLNTDAQLSVTQIGGDASAVQDLIDGNVNDAWASILSGNDRIVTSDASDYLRGFDGNDLISARGGNDVLFGDKGIDRLFGGNGNDYLNGGTGGDLMQGGNGNDRYISDNANDRIVEASASGTDTIFSSVGRSISENVENMFLTGSAVTWGVGNEGDNYIYGNARDNGINGAGGNDWLYGGDGNDRINGGRGDDHLIGGTGSDMFIFNDTAGQDVVHAYEHGIDRLNLAGIDADPSTPGDQAFTYIGHADFTGAAGELHYAGRVLSGDVTGDAHGDFAITIANHVAITQADLIL